MRKTSKLYYDPHYLIIVAKDTVGHKLVYKRVEARVLNVSEFPKEVLWIRRLIKTGQSILEMRRLYASIRTRGYAT